MSKFNNNSYLSAQRQYDAQEDPTYHTKTIDCERCDGTGEDEERITCKVCGGAGEIAIHIKSLGAYHQHRREEEP